MLPLSVSCFAAQHWDGRVHAYVVEHAGEAFIHPEGLGRVTVQEGDNRRQDDWDLLIHATSKKASINR